MNRRPSTRVLALVSGAMLEIACRGHASPEDRHAMTEHYVDLAVSDHAADQTERDYRALVKAAREGRIDAATEVCKAAPMPPLDILTTDVYADGGFAWRN